MASDASQRSGSRASNISRKRADVHKPYQHFNSQRKVEMMTKVAESWNDILQMSEQDLVEAKGYIARLEDEIEVKSRQLKSATGRSQEQEERIKQVEQRWNNFEAAESESRQANEGLTEEICVLRNELAKSQTQVASTSSKCKHYKAKINQAIAEQQELYKRSKVYYDDMVRQLTAEQESRTQKATEVDAALEESQRKRLELRQTMDEFKAEAREELKQKEEQIEKLQGELRHQQQNLTCERGGSQQLRERLEQAKGQHDQAIAELDAKIKTVAELSHETGRQSEQQSSATVLLAERLQTTNKSLETYYQNSLKPQDVSDFIASLEERIFERLQPHLDAVQTHQKDVENTAYRFSTTLNDQLVGIKEAMQHHVLSMVEKPDHTATITRVVDALGTLHNDMASTQDVCTTLQKRFEGWTGEELHALQEAHRLREEHLLQAFQERYESLSNREQQLQLLMEDYTSKIAQLSESRNSNEETENLVQLAAGVFKNSLDETLVKEREWLTQKLSKGEEAMSALESRLDNMVPANQPDVEGLQKDLDGERATVARLSDDIQKLRREAMSSEKLQQRWLHEIEQVESLRAKLSAVHPRMQRVEGIAAKLDSINRLNGLIHSTATYLAKEKRWVQDELEATAQGATSRSHPSGTQKADMPDRATVDGARGYDNDPFRDGRRVFVRSPWQDSEALFPPPDVAQEQRQRREAAKPRPILRFKSRAPSSSNPDLPPPPVMPKLESPTLPAKTVEQADAVVADLAPEARNDKSNRGFVNTISGYFASGINGAQKAFTTFAEFEQANRPIKKSASQESNRPIKKSDSQESKVEESAAPTESIHKISQRFMEPKDTSPGDLKVPGLRSKRTAPEDSSRPAPPLKRTQRRKTTF